jgi:hypothetical protein
VRLPAQGRQRRLIQVRSTHWDLDGRRVGNACCIARMLSRPTNLSPDCGISIT